MLLPRVQNDAGGPLGPPDKSLLDRIQAVERFDAALVHGPADADSVV
jgi:hypothetical protein